MEIRKENGHSVVRRFTSSRIEHLLLAQVFELLCGSPHREQPVQSDSIDADPLPSYGDENPNVSQELGRRRP